jgi:hypothetical protein
VTERVSLPEQEALNVTKRINSVSKYSVSSCGQKLLACNRTAPAVDLTGVNASALAATLNASLADAIIISGPSNLSNSISFDASSDPGRRPSVYFPLRLLHPRLAHPPPPLRVGCVIWGD